MNDERCCANCVFFRTVAPKDTEGDCRRYPPSADVGAWPIVNIEDWCGEFEAPEPEFPETFA